MSKLMRLNEIEDTSILEFIFNSEVMVFEDVQGSKIYVNWDGVDFKIKPKSVNSDPINLIDLAMQNYYNKAVDFFNSLDNRVKSLLNKNWWFGFEYFYDEQPANIVYSKLPKNNLVLTSICKSGKFNYTFEELEEYARLFDCDVIPLIFKGKLSQKAVEAINYFLNTSEDDLEFIFGEKSFSYFFYKILNPNLNNSFLMESDFQNNMEKIIIRVEDKELSFELLNPLYKRISDNNSTEFVEVYTLILVNFLNFSQSINLKDIKLKGNNREEAYIYLISKLFNVYISEVLPDIIQFNFTVPHFFDKDKFKINKELIPNKLTRKYLEEDTKVEYIFKVVLGSFNKKRKKPIGIFNDRTIEIFNEFVDEINSSIDFYLNKKSEIEITKRGLLDFSDFFDIKYEVDGEGEVYPDVYKEFEIRKGVDKKGKDKYYKNKKDTI